MFKNIMTGLVVIALALVVFVRAGQYGGRSGGQQTADIISSFGGATSSVFRTITGG